MRQWLIRKLGGYTSAREIGTDAWLETLRDLPYAERQKILQLAVKRMFNALGQDDILRVVGGKWLWQGKPLSIEYLKLLQAETESLRKSFLWKVLSSELRYRAINQLYTQAETSEDIVAAQLATYYIGIIEARLDDIERLKFDR